jgi:OmpA-OmpF porin, OOP family
VNHDAEERADRAKPALWIGVAGALMAALFGMFGPQDGSLLRAPNVLEGRVEAALAQAGFPGLDVIMRGQEAVVAGVVRERGDIASAARTALGAAGAGGLWAGGVTGVNAQGVAVGAFDQPFAWRAERAGKQIIMTGAAPSARARAALITHARAVFPNDEPVDRMHVAGGAPSANWTDAAEEAITDLVALNPGQVRFNGAQIVFIGDGKSDAVAALRRRYEHPRAPFTGRIEASVDGHVQGMAALQDINFANGDPTACEHAFERLMDSNVINFATGSAAIDESSMALIHDLGSVALRCDQSTIEVSGHTDNQGAPAANMVLSQARADAVAAALGAQGVARERLRAIGYGQTRPRASNRTASGQAANRRIEFTIESATP